MILPKYCIALAFLPFYLVFAFANENRVESLARLMRDLIKSEKSESIFWLKNCWHKHDNLKLIKSLHVSVKLTKTLFPINLTKVDDENNRNVWITIDMKCSDSNDFLKNMNQTYLGHPFRWIIIDGQESIYEKLSILPDSNVILVNSIDNNHSKYLLRQGKSFKFKENINFNHYFPSKMHFKYIKLAKMNRCYMKISDIGISRMV